VCSAKLKDVLERQTTPRAHKRPTFWQLQAKTGSIPATCASGPQNCRISQNMRFIHPLIDRLLVQEAPLWQILPQEFQLISAQLWHVHSRWCQWVCQSILPHTRRLTRFHIAWHFPDRHVVHRSDYYFKYNTS